jgi:hypothetical protein
MAFCSQPVHLAFVGYPLIAEDLKNLPDLLKDLPGEASALFALP